MAWELGDGGTGVLLCMEVRWWWKQSVVIAWKLGGSENISNWKCMAEY